MQCYMGVENRWTEFLRTTPGPSSGFANSSVTVLRSKMGTEHRFQMEILVHILSCLYVLVLSSRWISWTTSESPSSPIPLEGLCRQQCPRWRRDLICPESCVSDHVKTYFLEPA